MAERTPLVLNPEEEVDLSSLVIPKARDKSRGHDKEQEKAIKQAAEQSGFRSREATKPTRRRSRRTPYTEQKGIKVRPDMKFLFEDLADILEQKDSEVFEMAVLALIEKRNKKGELKEMLERYHDIIGR